MNVDPVTLVTILLMGIATYSTRLAGLVLVRRVPASGRLRNALEAVPAAVLTALVAPAVLAGGLAELIAGAVALLAALRFPLLAVVVLGAATAGLLRAAGL
ncbi:AzlD family protein [Amorphus orientalis]|uniref:Membrane protein n=1 Tax=Amorphus orientalis TaxID=649198 RepID=A0AAE4ASQ4_9HYPH|nr:AzlD domain-containing protein [Amorphus orientalis]MDQ0315270.1 putative membrane protein [Amorphus orientalis]